MSAVIVQELVDRLNLEHVAGPLTNEVSGVYIGDLLSNVMAKAKVGELWLTVHGHENVVAVAALTDVSAVVVVEGFPLDKDTAARAEAKGITLLRTSLSAAELMRKLIELGI